MISQPKRPHTLNKINLGLRGYRQSCCCHFLGTFTFSRPPRDTDNACSRNMKISKMQPLPSSPKRPQWMKLRVPTSERWAPPCPPLRISWPCCSPSYTLVFETCKQAFLHSLTHDADERSIEELTRSHRFRLSEGESAFASQVHLARSTCKLQTYFEWRMNQKERGADQSKSGIMAFIKLLTGQS